MRRALRGDSRCFFFQAEDGIRDKLVTGVQTCALPISYHEAGHAVVMNAIPEADPVQKITIVGRRSEERRVGKECRSGWAGDHLKKKFQKSFATAEQATFQIE